MTNERSSLITIGGEQQEMILTTRATKAIWQGTAAWTISATS